MSADAGLPNVGTATAPMQSLLTSDTNAGLSFGNGAAADYRPSLGLSGPLVRLDPQATASPSGVTTGCHPGATGAPAYVGSSGFLRSTAPTASPDPSAAEACAVSRASTISLFPTTFAPRGVIQIELQEASAHCVVSGVAHSPTVSYDYRAVVRYHDGGGGDDAYVQAAVITPAGHDRSTRRDRPDRRRRRRWPQAGRLRRVVVLAAREHPDAHLRQRRRCGPSARRGQADQPARARAPTRPRRPTGRSLPPSWTLPLPSPSAPAWSAAPPRTPDDRPDREGR